MTATRIERIGDATLYLGDCLGILPTLGKVDAVVTDPPYGVGLGATTGAGGNHGLRLDAYASYVDTYENYISQIVPAITSAIGLAERAAVFIGPHIHELPKFSALGGVYCSAASGRHQWGFKNFLPVLLYGSYPDLNAGAKIPTVLSSNETAEKNGHPVPKPLGWMKWLTSLCSRKGETILDPFMGSGTTGVACAKLGRRFIGIEIDPGYFDIACKRIDDAYRQRDMFRDEPKPAKPVQQSLLEPAA